MSPLINLLRTRKFTPMFLTMLTLTVNDSILRSAFLLFLTYGTHIHTTEASSTWADFLVGAMVLPFFALSSLGGDLADKFKKAKVMQLVKMTEIPIVCLTAYVLITEITNPLIYVGLALLMGIHSAFFSPAKYAYLPEYLSKDELLRGNSLVEGFTFIGILVGTSLGSLVLIDHYGSVIVSIIMIALAVGGYIASITIPDSPAADPTLKIRFNIFASTQKLIDQFSHQDIFWLPILGISWFWFIGTIIQTQFANYVLNSIHGMEGIVTLFNLVFTIGIGFGSLMCSYVMHDRLNARLTPISLFVMSLAGIHFYFGTSAMGTSTQLISLTDFLSTFQGWFLLIDIFCMCFAAGIYIIPLYTLLQKHSVKNYRSRVIACNNVINSIWMVAGNLVSLLFIRALGVKIETLLALVMVANLALVVHLTKMIPFGILKPIAQQLLKLLFRIEVSGQENLDNLPEKALIIANHASYVDPPILACFLPGEFVFAINPQIAEWKIVRMLKHLADTFSVDTSNPLKTKAIIKKINEGNRCIIFPEGRITDTGNIMKIYQGTAMIAQHTDALIIPIYIEGAQYCEFSRAKKLYKSRFFPKITINIGKPFKPSVNHSVGPKDQRKLITQQIYDTLISTGIDGATTKPIYDMLLEARKLHGGNFEVLNDFNNQSFTYNSLITKSEVLGHHFSQRFKDTNTYIGVLLPNVSAIAVVVMSLYRSGKVPAMMNYTADTHTLKSACQTMAIKTLITSRAFIEKANLQEHIDYIKEYLDEIIYLEDTKRQISILEKVTGLINSWRPKPTMKDLDDPAVVLYTSGSEGMPKAVLLSHRNIVTNIHQTCSVVDFSNRDTLFNILPMFHAFGFTLGTLTPLLKGIKCYLYPNPRHYNIVTELIYDIQATIMIGTNAFLKTYQQSGSAINFASLRYVFAGGEKLSDQTRMDWLDQFGKMILQGYGTTECAPVLAVNTMHYLKTGTVGRLLPGLEHKLEKFEDYNDRGILHIKGKNVMLGYVYADDPLTIHPPKDGWYNTGDVVTVDTFGFIKIVDRVKRFAKIAAEMVSLTAVEKHITECLEEVHVAVIAIEDNRKGEKLVLITDQPCEMKKIKQHFIAQKYNMLMMPSEHMLIDEMPQLSTGKTDYPAIKQYVLKMNESSSE